MSLSRLSQTEKAERTVDFAEFAALYGCRRSYVTKLRHAGRLVLTEDGKRVMVNASFARIEETKDPAKQPQEAPRTAAEAQRNGESQGVTIGNGKNGAQNVPESSVDENGETQPTDDGYGYQAARAKKERYLAEMARLEYEREAGKVLPIDVVTASVANAATQIRTRLESLPAILAPRLASETDEQAVAAVMAEEIEHMLGELSRQLTQVGG